MSPMRKRRGGGTEIGLGEMKTRRGMETFPLGLDARDELNIGLANEELSYFRKNHFSCRHIIKGVPKQVSPLKG